MAKIVETVFVLKLSQLIKDKDESVSQKNFDDLSSTVEQVVQELVGNDVIVEIERA